MQRLQRTVSATAVAALLAWAIPAGAAPIEPEDEPASAGSEAAGVPVGATWLLIEARDHARGTSGAAAVLFGVAEERGRQRQASLRVDCFEGRTVLHVDTVGFGLGPSVAAVAVPVAYSLDGGRFVSASWRASADGSGLKLSGERAIAFLGELYGKAELRLALVRPLSVPFLFTFAVGGAEQALGTMADRCHWSAAPAVSEARP
ncbi:MAG: hypothetical protein ACXWK3_19205 [Reyranella sp.]